MAATHGEMFFQYFPDRGVYLKVRGFSGLLLDDQQPLYRGGLIGIRKVPESDNAVYLLPRSVVY